MLISEARNPLPHGVFPRIAPLNKINSRSRCWNPLVLFSDRMDEIATAFGKLTVTSLTMISFFVTLSLSKGNSLQKF
jgi:hypothetical protein